MKLLVGLGNPGSKYETTRHNIGFMVIDHLIDQTRAVKATKASFQGELYKSSDLLLLKPTTFMNLSGQSVQAVASYYRIELNDIIVIHDDLDIPFGALRFKLGGGSGGHNGLKSIDQHCGQNYLRVRTGIGKPQDKNRVADYVLSPFGVQEKENLQDLITCSAQGALALMTQPLTQVSSTLTRKG